MTTPATTTLDEFVASIDDFDDLQPAVQTDLIAYHFTKVRNVPVVGGNDLANARSNLRLAPHPSLALYLNGSITKQSKPRYVRVGTGYALERSYAATLETTYLGRPAARVVAQDLRAELKKITDASILLYLEETIKCFECELFRSSIVMSWCVTYGVFREWLFKNHLGAFNTLTGAWKDPVTISNLDDFQDLLEARVIDTARKGKLVSMETAKTLRQLLDQRNSYAHPSNKPISPSFAETYIERVLHEILPTFK